MQQKMFGIAFGDIRTQEYWLEGDHPNRWSTAANRIHNSQYLYKYTGISKNILAPLPKTFGSATVGEG